MNVWLCTIEQSAQMIWSTVVYRQTVRTQNMRRADPDFSSFQPPSLRIQTLYHVLQQDCLHVSSIPTWRIGHVMLQYCYSQDSTAKPISTC